MSETALKPGLTSVLFGRASRFFVSPGSHGERPKSDGNQGGKSSQHGDALRMQAVVESKTDEKRGDSDRKSEKAVLGGEDASPEVVVCDHLQESGRTNPDHRSTRVGQYDANTRHRYSGRLRHQQISAPVHEVAKQSPPAKPLQIDPAPLRGNQWAEQCAQSARAHENAHCEDRG